MVITSGIARAKILFNTCANPRCVRQRFLDLSKSDAAVIQNITGRVAPLLNDVVALDKVLSLADVCIIHHTYCGDL